MIPHDRKDLDRLRRQNKKRLLGMKRSLRREEVANHLRLALEITDDPDLFRQRVQAIYDVIKPKRVIRSREFHHISSHLMAIILDRSDARTVEEIFFEYIDRHQIKGQWTVDIKRFVKLTPFTYKFIATRKVELEFGIVKSREDRKKSKGADAAKTDKVTVVQQVERTFEALAEEDQDAMIARLLAARRNKG